MRRLPASESRCIRPGTFAMTCGLGVCWTCVVPVVRRDGSGWDNLRSCVEGPVFNGARIWWEKWFRGPTVPTHTPPHGFTLDGVGGEAWHEAE